MLSVFVSASVPDPRRDTNYHRTAHPLRIREAITQLARAVLPLGELVFGGHPAVSPLVLAVATQLGASSRAAIFQSEFFRGRVPRDSLVFPRLTWTPAVGHDQSKSLAAMRTLMIRSREFEAAFFIGGMEGVEEEYSVFRQEWPQAAAYPIASTGGAARLLFARGAGAQAPSLRQQLDRDTVYGHLFRKLLNLVP